MRADLIRRMVEAGMPADLIADIAVELATAAASSSALEARRSSDRGRKAAERSRVRGSHVTSEEAADLNAPRMVPPERDQTTPPLTPQTVSETLARKPAVARHIPDDWHPEPLTGVSAQTVARWQAGELERELSKFRDHWAAAATPTAKKRDWQAAWRTWIGNHDERRTRNPTGGQPGTNHRQPTRPSDGFASAIATDLAELGSRRAAHADQGRARADDVEPARCPPLRLAFAGPSYA